MRSQIPSLQDNLPSSYVDKGTPPSTTDPVSQPHSDTWTVLTCEPRYHATKAHTLTEEGWEKEGFSRGSTFFDRRTVSFNSFDSMAKELARLVNCPRSFLIRDSARPGEPLRHIRRKKLHFSAHPVGHRAVLLDVDKLPLDLLGGDFDPNRRESLERAVRAAEIAAGVPPELRGASVFYQLSSSAGVYGWQTLDIHLAYFLNRPVGRQSLNAWAKGQPYIDHALFHPVQPHYTAAPLFLREQDFEGERWQRRQLPPGADPLGEDRQGPLRFGVIRRETDTATTPPEWVDRPTWEAREAERRAREKRKKKRALSARRKARSAPEGVSTEVTQHLQYMNRVIRVAEDEPFTEGGESGGHPTMGRIIWNAARRCKHLLHTPEIGGAFSELEALAIRRLSGHQGRSCATATAEVERLVQGAVDKAPSEPLAPRARTRYHRTQRDKDATARVLAATAALRLLPPTSDELTTSPHGNTETAAEFIPFKTCAALPEVLGCCSTTGLIECVEDTRAPLNLSNPGAALRNAQDDARGRGRVWNMPPELEQITPISLEEARARLPREAVELANQRITATLIGDPGVGKTYAAGLAALSISERNERTLMFSGSSRKVTQGARSDFLELANAQGASPRAEVAVTRRATNCRFSTEVEAAERSAPWGGSLFCRRCEDHPSNTDDGKPRCQYMRDRGKEQGADVVFMTHARGIAELNRIRCVPDAKVTWLELTQAARDGGGWRPFVSRTYETLHIGVTPSRNGPDLPPLELTKKNKPTAQWRRAALEWIARAWDLDTSDLDPEIYQAKAIEKFLRERVGEVAGERVERWPWGLLIIDEDITSALRSTGQLTEHELLDARNAGMIKVHNDAAWGALLSAIPSGERIGTEVLHEICPPGAIEVVQDWSAAHTRITEASGLGERSARIAKLLEAIPWRTIAGLEQALQNGWGCASIGKGALRVIHALPFNPRELARSTLYLDATASPARARALFGPDCVVKHYKVELPEHAKVLWCPADTGVSSRLVDSEGLPGGQRVPLIWAANMLRFGCGPDALIVTSLRNRDLMTWTGHVLSKIEENGAAVTHHNGPESRGVNLYRDRNTVVIDPWHIPVHVLEQQAFTWCMVAGENWNDPTTRARWKVEAHYQHLGAVVIQEGYRIRPGEATASNPKQIVIVDSRDPETLGLPVSKLIDPDRLVYDTFGTTTGVRTALTILPDVLQRAGGVYCPGVDARSPAPMLARGDVTGTPVDCPIDLYDTLRNYLSHALTAPSAPSQVCLNWAENNGGWEELAEHMRDGGWDIGVTMVEHDRPGRAWPVLHSGELNAGQLAGWLRQGGVRRYRIAGEETWVDIDGLPEELSRALFDLEGLERMGGIVRALEQLAEVAGVSPRTARRWVTDRRMVGETTGDTFARLWHAARSDAASDWMEDSAVLWLDQGARLDEALEFALEDFRLTQSLPPGAWMLEEIATALDAQDRRPDDPVHWRVSPD